MILLNVRYCVKPGSRDLVLALAKEMQTYARTEDGNIEYLQLPSIENENEMIVIEKWTSPEAVRAHQTSTVYKQFSEARRPYLIEGSMIIQSYRAEETAD